MMDENEIENQEGDSVWASTKLIDNVHLET